MNRESFDLTMETERHSQLAGTPISYSECSNLEIETGYPVRRGGRIGSWWGNRRERDRWGDLGVDGGIILGWICRRWVVGMWTGLG